MIVITFVFTIAYLAYHAEDEDLLALQNAGAYTIIIVGPIR